MSAAAAACAPTRLGATTLTFAAPMPASPEPEARRAAAAEPKRCDVHPQLWRACAGSLCAVPPVGAAVYYFPQGHAEHATGAAVDLRATGVPPFVPCRLTAVRLMAEPDTDDIYAKISLVPLRPWEPVEDVGDAALKTDGSSGGGGGQPQRLSFAKTLTASDANNGGGFSVPRFCALSIFPELDYTSVPPVQTLPATDVHGVEWTFRHIYRGTPRRHLLTTGWSNFVSSKNLLAGDSVVFVREEDGKVHVGLRRANKRVVCGRGCRGNAGCPGADAVAGPSDGKVSAEDVVAAATRAAAGERFEVVYYPRASAPAFCVRASAVKESMQAPWYPGLRFKMAFETEDLSRISWFMGTVAGVEPADPAMWPHSPWRLLQVTWDEPDLLQNVTRVCPWRVELASSMPNLRRFSSPPPCKKPRTESHSERRLLSNAAVFPPNHALELAPPHPAQNQDRDCHGFVPSFPFPAVPDSIAAAAAAAASGMQGTRHPQFVPFSQFVPLFSDLHLNNLQQSLLFCGIHPADRQDPPAPTIVTDLKIGSPTPDDVKPPGIMLFGRSIQTEEQMKSNSSTRSGSSNTSGSGVTHASPVKRNSPSLSLWWSGDSPSSEFGLEPGQCKVFAESDAVGRNLDLSALGSFEELCARLSSMFCIDNADLRSHMVYHTIASEVKHVGDEPFSAFVKSAQRITILNDAGSDNTGSR